MAQDLNDPKTSQYHDLILFTAVVCVVTRHARLFLLRRSVALRKWSYNRRFASAIFSATQRYNIVTTLLRIVTTLFQHCNDVLRWKSSLRIVPCNITLGGYDFVCNKKFNLTKIFLPKGVKCYTRRFVTTIFSATQRCTIVSKGDNIVPTLQRCVALKIVVANRAV